MTVTLSHIKAENIKQDCSNLLTKKQPTIREVATVIGKLVASCPVVHMGPLFFRQLENEKTASLNLLSVGANDFSSVRYEHTNTLPGYKSKVAWLPRVGKAL